MVIIEVIHFTINGKCYTAKNGISFSLPPGTINFIRKAALMERNHLRNFILLQNGSSYRIKLTKQINLATRIKSYIIKSDIRHQTCFFTSQFFFVNAQTSVVVPQLQNKKRGIVKNCIFKPAIFVSQLNKSYMTTRRSFIKFTSLLSAGFWIVPADLLWKKFLIGLQLPYPKQGFYRSWQWCY